VSDHIQTIVDPEASAAQALLSGARIWTWLVDEQIVGGAVVDVVGPHRIPGERAGAWLGEKRQLGDLVSGTYGDVSVTTEKTVFFNPDGPRLMRCPRGHAEPMSGTDETFLRAVDAWWSDSDDGWLRCAACKADHHLPTIRFEPAWAFGYLGVEFVNWPPVSTLLETLMGLCDGHRLVLLMRKQ
jgi:hypothetical protein